MSNDRQGSGAIWGNTHTYQGALRMRFENFSGRKILEGNYLGARSAGSRPVWGHVHTDQAALRIQSKDSSGLKFLKGSYLGARSARLKIHMGQCTYRSGHSTNSI